MLQQTSYSGKTEGRRGERLVLYVEDQCEHVEVSYGKEDRSVECLYVKIRGIAVKGHLGVEVCLRTAPLW